jgi:hypothetical protein
MNSNKCVFGSHILFNTMIYLRSLGPVSIKLSQRFLVVNNYQKGDYALNHITIGSNNSAIFNQDSSLATKIPIILHSKAGDFYQYDGNSKLLTFIAQAGLVNKNNEILVEQDYLGSSSVHTKTGLLMKESDVNNFIVFKTARMTNAPTEGLDEKFLLNKKYLPEYSWRTNKN